MFRPFVLSQTRHARKTGQPNGSRKLRWRPRFLMGGFGFMAAEQTCQIVPRQELGNIPA